MEYVSGTKERVHSTKKEFECYECSNDSMTVEIIGRKAFFVHTVKNKDGETKTAIMLGSREANRLEKLLKERR